MENVTRKSKIGFWSGWVLKGLLSLFLLFDAMMKIIKHPQAVEGTKQLGLPESCIQPLGIYLLITTILFLYNRTVIMGALLITAYLGGAVAIMFSAQKEGHPYLFPVVFAILLWIAEYVRNEKIRNFIPFTK
jgi:hypothetical protein